jgi:hypothetical protein
MDEGKVESQSDQNNEQRNDCDDSVSGCDNLGTNNLQIDATDESKVDSDNQQTMLRTMTAR